MIIYRVEHTETGAGPYRSQDHGGSLLAGIGSAHVNDSHPAEGQDFRAGTRTKCRRFGFETPEQLSAWFAGWGRVLRDSGYQIKRYRINKRAVSFGQSGLQLCFDHVRATHLEDIEIDFA